MYNSIYPVNINYTHHNKYRNNSDSSQPAKTQINPDGQEQNNNQNTFPNGTKVAIDYTKGQINISQVLTDFRNTIVAINAPDEVRDEINVYLNLVDKESRKNEPSREIIVSNLKNASRISDSYIASALNKPSNVVEKWIETLFLQRINLKADPEEINPDFQLEFPQKAQERINAQVQIQNDEYVEDESNTLSQDSNIEKLKITNETSEKLSTESEFELTQEGQTTSLPIVYTEVSTPFSPRNEADYKARELFAQAKKAPKDNIGDAQAINLLNEALGLLSGNDDSNPNIRAVLHIERGKIFDSYDYVDYALRDYFEATKAKDYNLKAQAHYKSGRIYDEFSEFYPAMDNYLSSVAYSAEAENTEGQSKVLTKIASLFTRQFNIEKALEYGELAIDTANSTDNTSLIASTYSSDAQNSQYLGQNDRAIDSYKNALLGFSQTNESFETMAYNYEQAALVMRKLGNHAKAAKLQVKANQYYQKAQQQQELLEQAG